MYAIRPRPSSVGRRESHRSDQIDRAHAVLVLGELDDDPGHHLTPAYRAFDATGALTDDRIDAIEDATRHE